MLVVLSGAIGNAYSLARRLLVEVPCPPLVLSARKADFLFADESSVPFAATPASSLSQECQSLGLFPPTRFLPAAATYNSRLGVSSVTPLTLT